jgi:hypothetical protein
MRCIFPQNHFFYGQNISESYRNRLQQRYGLTTIQDIIQFTSGS